MVKIFDYCCLECWHTWMSRKQFVQCPKCKSTKLDVKEDILPFE